MRSRFLTVARNIQYHLRLPLGPILRFSHSSLTGSLILLQTPSWFLPQCFLSLPAPPDPQVASSFTGLRPLLKRPLLREPADPNSRKVPLPLLFCLSPLPCFIYLILYKLLCKTILFSFWLLFVLPSLEYKLLEGRDFVYLVSFSPQSLQWCLAHSKYSNSISCHGCKHAWHYPFHKEWISFLISAL